MANPEHVAKLKKEIASWNRWRDENRDLSPDLSGADFSRADLTGARLYALSEWSSSRRVDPGGGAGKRSPPPIAIGGRSGTRNPRVRQRMEAVVIYKGTSRGG